MLNMKKLLTKLLVKKDGTLASGKVLYARRGNVVMVHVDNFSITNTSSITLLGTLPSDCVPSLQLYASGFASGGVVSYVRVDADGKVYGYRSAAGNLLASITFGTV